MSVKLLDVTLRDGGYRTNFHFSQDVIHRVLTSLDQSGLHYIEIGYRNGSFRITPDIGSAGMCKHEYLEYCRKRVKYSKLTVMFHPRNINLHDLEEMRDCGVDCVRICFPMLNPALGFEAIEMAKSCGFEVFTNITRVSQYGREKIINSAIELASYGPKGVYFADSNGSLTPRMVGDLFAHLKSRCPFHFGFHAHDNLFLAQANAVTAIENGAEFIDASLSGCGKGAGNLHTEGIVSFLRSQGIKDFDVCQLLEASEFVKQNIGNTEKYYGKDIILGMFDLSQDDANNLGDFCNVEDYYSRAARYSLNNGVGAAGK